MTAYTIETGEQVTLSIDGGEPQPVESIEAACEAIEQAEGLGSPQEDAMEAEQQGMQAGFAGARGNQAGMLGG
jgi:hypothetical protein